MISELQTDLIYRWINDATKRSTCLLKEPKLDDKINIDIRWVNSKGSPVDPESAHNESSQKVAKIISHKLAKSLNYVFDHRSPTVLLIDVPISLAQDPCSVPKLTPVIRLSQQITLGGRYCKLKRDISQTPWSYSSQSVSGIIENALKSVFNFSSTKFLAAGREDADVLMLGDGRPFAIIIFDPKPKSQWPTDEEILSALKKSDQVVVPTFKYISSHCLPLLLAGESAKRKQYKCLVSVEKVSPQATERVNGLKNIILNQYTPIRVVHRRANLKREKTIYWITATPVSETLLQVNLEAQAGTYIKEFITSDMGRTSPSFGSLYGCAAEIHELDVCNVIMEWPPEFMSN